jgi:hypothetical protein
MFVPPAQQEGLEGEKELWGREKRRRKRGEWSEKTRIEEGEG